MVLVLPAWSNRVRKLANVSTRCSGLLQGLTFAEHLVETSARFLTLLLQAGKREPSTVF